MDETKTKALGLGRVLAFSKKNSVFAKFQSNSTQRGLVLVERLPPRYLSLYFDPRPAISVFFWPFTKIKMPPPCALSLSHVLCLTYRKWESAVSPTSTSIAAFLVLIQQGARDVAQNPYGKMPFV
jgi:hypothetical protein